jgi:D-amino-acid dehydrogenase
MTAQRVVVIGAGIIGAAAALVLQRRGSSVTLVDASEPGMGCSYGNGGAISPDFCVPASLPGMLARVPRWFADPDGPLVVRWSRVPAAAPWLLRWVREGNMDRARASSSALRALHGPCLAAYDRLLGPGNDLIERTGQLYVWRSASASPTEAIAQSLREEHGVVMRVLDAQAIRELDPDLAPGFTRGLHFPENGHTVNPLRLVRALVALFVDAGGKFERRRVRRFEVRGRHASAAQCSGAADLVADTFVLATGIDSRKFANVLGDRVPLEAERGYHVMLPDPLVRPRIKISNRDHMFGLTSMEHGVRISGTVEFAPPGAPMNERRARSLLAHAKRMYPGLNGEGAQFWMGSRPSTPDSLPVIGHARRARNVVYAFGHGHTGLTGAPMTAELVASLVTGSPPPIDAAPYRPSRF